jgi:predicted kinase
MSENQYGKIYLLCGLPGAGKTTYAKELESKGVIRFCPDDWILSILGVEYTREKDAEIRTNLEKQMLNMAVNICKQGYDVVLENGFWTKSERDEYQNFANDFGIPTKLVYLPAIKEVLWSRIQERNKTLFPVAFRNNYDELDRWLKVFEEPSEDEADIIVAEIGG